MRRDAFCGSGYSICCYRVVKLLVDEELCSFQEQKEWATDPLKKIFLDTIRGGENSIIDNSDYLESMGIPEKTATAGSVWKHLVKKLFLHQSGSISTYYPFLETILTEGTLSTRILRAAAGNTGRENIKRVYRALSECLKNGKMFSDKPDLK